MMPDEFATIARRSQTLFPVIAAVVLALAITSVATAVWVR
jgi:hypothetical protein